MSMVAESVSGRSEAALRIMDRSVVLTLTRHYLGNHRKVDTRAVAQAVANVRETPSHPADIDPKQFNTTMKLIDQRELTDVMRELSRAKGYLRRMSIQSHRIFGDRTYLVPIAAVSIVDAELQKIHRAILDEAAALASRYAQCVERQREQLGPMFDPTAYVTPADVAQAFGIDWSYVSFQAPERLETVDRALFENARDKHEAKMAECYEEVRLVLRETLRQIVADIARKLENDPETGERRSFKGTVLTDLREYLETFSFRNIADDDELARVVASLRAATDGVDVQSLRDLDVLRLNVQQVAAAATATLDELVVTGRSVVVGSGRLQ